LWAFLVARWYGIENDLTKKMGFPLPDKPSEVETYNNEPNPEVEQPYEPEWDNDLDEDLDEDLR
jgi:hypothetical protein